MGKERNGNEIIPQVEPDCLWVWMSVGVGVTIIHFTWMPPCLQHERQTDTHRETHMRTEREREIV